MQILIILLCVAVSCLWMRGSDDDLKKYKQKQRSAKDRDQLIQLRERVSVLEDILLDRERDRRLRR